MAEVHAGVSEADAGERRREVHLGAGLPKRNLLISQALKQENICLHVVLVVDGAREVLLHDAEGVLRPHVRDGVGALEN